MESLSKTCIECNLEKEITEFHKKHKGKYGVNSKCKSCVVLWSVEYRSKIEHTEVKEKQCSSCLETKDIELFSKRKDSLDGRKGVCNKCTSIRMAKKEGRKYVDKKALREIGLKSCVTCGQIKGETLFLTDYGTCKDCIKSREKNTVLSKFCSKCKETKEYINFYKSSYRPDGLEHHCISCKKEANDKLNFIRDDSVFKLCTICTTFYEACDFHSNKNSKDGLSDVCKSCAKNKTAEWRLNNKERVSEYNKELMEKNPIYKKSQSIRRTISNSFYRACKGKYDKNDTTENILGCTILEFLDYLESLFKENMTWENKGACKNGNCDEVWHIDHIIPLATAKTEEEVYLLNHYTNLQPMWASENLSKGKKIDYEQ